MVFECVNSLAALAASDTGLEKPLTRFKQCMLTCWTKGQPQSTVAIGPTMGHYAKQTCEAATPKTALTLIYSVEVFLSKYFVCIHLLGGCGIIRVFSRRRWVV